MPSAGSTPIPLEKSERRRVLTAKCDLKMARSAHAYVHRSTERFYEWIESNAVTALPTGPSV